MTENRIHPLVSFLKEREIHAQAHIYDSAVIIEVTLEEEGSRPRVQSGEAGSDNHGSNCLSPDAIPDSSGEGSLVFHLPIVKIDAKEEGRIRWGHRVERDHPSRFTEDDATMDVALGHVLTPGAPRRFFHVSG